MKKQIALIVFGLLLVANAVGQGFCRGKITDENGEPLTGATVYLKADMSVGTITDFDGNYSLTLNAGGPHTLVVSFMSFRTIESEIKFSGDKVIIKNFVMTPATMELEDVVIKGRVNKANDSYMKAKKIQSAISIDYISTETIKKTGDSNIRDAVKRVSGVSTIGSFITVRGLADRYIKTTVNGARIPTLDPYTNNIKLDLFPTSLVDNIVISKTASSTLPGDWSGAYLSIETKDYPNKFTLHVKSSFGYNTQSTFEDIVTSKKSSTDWLGYDNGYRDIKHMDRENFPNYQSVPAMYDEYMALSQKYPGLGIEEYIQSLGINETHLGIGSINNIYNRLLLVHVGLLPPALINDQPSVDFANAQYAEIYKDDAFRMVNDPAVQFGRSLPNNWRVERRKAPINFSQEFSLGNQTTLFGKTLGYLFGFRYSQDVKYDPNAEIRRYTNTVTTIAQDSLNLEGSIESNSWSGLVNLAYKFTPNHSVSLLFMPNFKGENKARIAQGREGEGDFLYDIIEEQVYEERKQLIYQYKSNHYFPAWGLRAEARVSYTDGESNTPDFKSVKYGAEEDSYEFSNRDKPSRYWRYLEQNILDANLAFELPIWKRPGLTRKLFFGGSYQETTRDFKQYKYVIELENNPQLIIPDGDLSKYFNLDKFNWNEDSTGVALTYYNDPSLSSWGRNLTTGYSKISAAYFMVDFNINKWWRLTAGVRAEYTDMFSDQLLLLGLPEDHIDRNEVGFGSTSAQAAEINDTHFMPSGNMIFKLVNSEKVKVNTRLNYSQSIARPNVREISYAYVYDYELRQHILGNPDLGITTIDNYDFRIESFFDNGDNLSASVFYKDFYDFIEVVDRGNYYTWENKDNAWVYGLELEARKKVFKNLELGANVTIAKSETIDNKDDVSKEEKVRPLFGQAPYVVNGLLNYSSDKLGLSFSVSYNRQGERLSIVNNFFHDVYELPRHLVDAKISKKLGDHFGISLKVRDILQEPVVRAYKYDDFSYIYDSYIWGTTYVFSISYEL